MMPNRPLSTIVQRNYFDKTKQLAAAARSTVPLSDLFPAKNAASVNMYEGIAMAPDLIQRCIRALWIRLVDAIPWIQIFFKLNHF